MIPAPTPSNIAWVASPIQRARWTQSAATMSRARCKPVVKSEPVLNDLEPGENLSEAAKIHPKLADHWFVRKSGRTLSDSAIRLLRLRDWLETCLTEGFHSDAYITESRLREQAAFIIGWCA